MNTDLKNGSFELFRRVPVAWAGEEVKPVQVSSAKNATLMGLEFHPVLAVRTKLGRAPDAERH